MADPKTDFSRMSDEDFLKLSEEDYSGDAPEGQTLLSSQEEESYVEPVQTPANSENDEENDSSTDGSQSDDSGDSSDSKSDEDFEENNKPNEDVGQINPHQSDGTPNEEETSNSEDNIKPDANSEEEEKKTSVQNEDVNKPKGEDTPAKAGYYKLPEGMDTAGVDEAIGFYKKLTAPFKADGRDFTVRSPEDAIRLLQQGVNYSRRMQEIKPMKALDRMLSDHGLNEPEKLNFLIDLSKGDKEAITQLLKSHKIDPMDLDLEKDSGYQARNYQGNPQDNEFRDALDTALTTPEGQALVSHIHKDWDPASKAQLRNDPSILGTLSEYKASGVYDKVVEELEYQRSIGFLNGVPFLKAFDQVGEAMKKAGVFGSPNPAQNGDSMAPLSGQTQSQPVLSGARKSTGTKKPETNPHLSSTPPAKQSGNTGKPEPDFGKMSDEEFLKMPPPE